VLLLKFFTVKITTFSWLYDGSVVGFSSFLASKYIPIVKDKLK